ncbi:hypothetical protein BK672_28700 [Pseudomonas fluorescens]|uniref:Uncharacterized protein n=1 Tax=Pseudomonas fluorescens TaxID=294 RepID=A0A423MSJ4_PSEFL|nr:hypothetical protein BK672_28700 [Pseudomonas fluorescens]
MKRTKNNSFRVVQTDILTKGHPSYYLSQGRALVSPSDYANLAAWVMSARKRGQLVLQKYIQGLFPKKIELLKNNPVFNKVGAVKEVHWSAALIMANANRVVRFVGLSSDFERFFLSSDYEKCLEVLGVVEAEFGVSQWLIENKIAVLQVGKGIESQKKYVQEIKAKGTSNIPWLAYTFSRRNEETTTYFRFVSQTIDFLSELEHPALKSSLMFRALSIFPPEVESIGDILHYESNSPLIDIFTTFMFVAQVVIAGDVTELKESVLQCLVVLAPKINDPRINRLLFIAGLSSDPCQRQCAIAEAECSLESASVPLTYSDWPIIWRDEAIESLRTGREINVDGTLQKNIASDLLHIYREGSLADEDIGRKLKDCLNYRWMSFSNVFEELLWREFSSDGIADSRLALIRFVNTMYLDPELLRYLPDASRDTYHQKLIREGGDSFILRANLSLANKDFSSFKSMESDDDESIVLLQAELAFSKEAYNDVMEICSPLLQSRNVRMRRVASRLTAHALGLNTKLGPLVDFVSSSCVLDRGIVNMMPIQSCAERLDKKARKELACKLSTPIVLSLYSRNFDDTYDKELSYAYEDFLIRKGLSKPSELHSIAIDLNKDELVYYLKYICTPDIMKVSTVFNGTAELQNERLAVCYLLLKYDESNAKDYEFEIREITRAQAIRKGVRHVEQSKMSIDVAALRKWADKKLKESFLRYQALLKAGFNPAAGFKEALLDSLSAGRPMPREFFEVPTDEASSLLKDIVYSIIQECTINPMHGLDCYLSMRIRHGALSGQLRGPLESERIITQKKSDQESYASNDFWNDKLSVLPQAVRENVDINLCMFSASYDNIIEEVTNQQIQIYTKEKPDGLFNVTFTYADIRFVATFIDEESTFDVFFDQCIDLFWRSVGTCLERVHHYIDGVLKPSLNIAFNKLQENVSAVSVGHSTAELDRSIRTAQTNAQQALEQIKDWFKLPTPRVEPPFEMQELIDIGLQCVQRIHRDFNPVIKTEISSLPPLADALTTFSDIFFIIFDNIRKYSAMGDSPNISIKIIKEFGGVVKLVVENDVDFAVGSGCDAGRVESIKKIIENGSYQNSVKSEGGTGLIKLKKIIGPSRYMDFGYSEDSKFFVEFTLTLREITI